MENKTRKLTALVYSQREIALKVNISGRQVDITLGSNQDYYPSIEHVIPVSKGGTHTLGNVKLLHRKCNYLKLYPRFKNLVF